MVRIAILDLTDLPKEFGRSAKVGDLIGDWLQPAMPCDDLTIVHVAIGAPVPDISEFDGFVLSGSELGVYDTPPWMDALRALILSAQENQVPLFGICFGHQIMADTLGGKAELVSAGNVIGTRRFQIDGTLTDAHVWHQDQVVKVPQGATVIGRADYCPVAVLAYDFPAMSVQFHPEYSRDFLDGAIVTCTGTLLDPELAGNARETLLNGAVPVGLMAVEAARTLRGEIRET